MSTNTPNDTAPRSETPAEVWPPPPINVAVDPPAIDLPPFKRQNIFVLLVLYLGTLGIYGFFWMHRQIKVVNARVDPPPMSLIAFWVLVGMFALNIGLGFTGVPEDTSRIFGWATGVGWLILYFNLRTALNVAFRVQPGDLAFSNKIGTFFFSLIYLQHKINTYLRNEPSSLAFSK
jgi:hypothetical protein